MLTSQPALPASPAARGRPRPQLIEYTLRSCPSSTAAGSHRCSCTRSQMRTVPSSDADARKRPSGENASAHTVDACPLSVWKQYQSSCGSSMYSFIVSSYEAEARICAGCRVSGAREAEARGGAGDGETDLFRGVPRDGLDVLGVLHEHAHALEVVVRVHCMRAHGSASSKNGHRAGGRAHRARG